MKVKIFVNNDEAQLENDVNQWLKDNANINIVDKMVRTSATNLYARTHIVIWYKE